MKKQTYKTRIMPENVFFMLCKNDKGEKWYDISLNGASYPEIEDVKRMKTTISNLLIKMEKIGQNEIDKINKEIKDKQIREMNETNRQLKNVKITEKKKGNIYLLKSNGLYKIGRASKIKDRIDLYKTENPFGIKVIFQKEVDDYIEVETFLLKTFKDKLAKGKEWFKLNNKDIQWIKQNI